jgi:hypothetical protein
MNQYLTVDSEHNTFKLLPDLPVINQIKPEVMQAED